MFVISCGDLDAGALSMRLHGKGPQDARAEAEDVTDILAAIQERRAQRL